MACRRRITRVVGLAVAMRERIHVESDRSQRLCCFEEPR